MTVEETRNGAKEVNDEGDYFDEPHVAPSGPGTICGQS